MVIAIIRYLIPILISAKRNIRLKSLETIHVSVTLPSAIKLLTEEYNYILLLQTSEYSNYKKGIKSYSDRQQG